MTTGNWDPISVEVSTFLHLLESTKQEQQRELYKARKSGALPKNNLIGRDKYKEFVIQWLRMPSNEHPGTDLYRNISLLSIVGHGGMGKITLLQHAYKDEMTEEFDLKMWVCVSNNFEVKKVIADMLESHQFGIWLVEATEMDKYARGMTGTLGSSLFEELGLYYIGPVKGLNIDDLVTKFQKVKFMPAPGPVPVHVTEKRKCVFVSFYHLQTTYVIWNLGYLILELTRIGLAITSTYVSAFGGFLLENMYKRIKIFDPGGLLSPSRHVPRRSRGLPS
ncbi:hypothetical protein M5K25_025485 [Dendrobium thyrsiflorum]|uniref:NB-ARC domain-containing protein n=1 Tax=Dendrobium thyrsiflorum TaxID=117978 RepID=A0ABD0U439_DENTH